MIRSLNHITLSVSNLERSFQFYTAILGLKPVAKWIKGAYLEAGDLWLCLSLDDATRKTPLDEYTHIALTVSAEDFETFSNILIEKGIQQWKKNKSEGNSLYILDPDGHKWEIHVGSLKSRLNYLKDHPYEGLKLY